MNQATLHVLCIGPADRCDSIRDTFRQRGRCCLSVTTSYRELFRFPKRESFDVVILHQMLSVSEFYDSCAYIRRTWPCAKILAICPEADVLDDPLYDDWVAPSHSPDLLLATIEQLAACGGSLHKCAYEPCQRLIPLMQEYCSAYCSEADDVDGAELVCDFSHDNCALNERFNYPQLVTKAEALRETARLSDGIAALPHDSSRSFVN
jgi:hypothetical protein